jgi:hypothetical protein
MPDFMDSCMGVLQSVLGAPAPDTTPALDSQVPGHFEDNDCEWREYLRRAKFNFVRIIKEWNDPRVHDKGRRRVAHREQTWEKYEEGEQVFKLVRVQAQARQRGWVRPVEPRKQSAQSRKAAAAAAAAAAATAAAEQAKLEALTAYLLARVEAARQQARGAPACALPEVQTAAANKGQQPAELVAAGAAGVQTAAVAVINQPAAVAQQLAVQQPQVLPTSAVVAQPKLVQLQAPAAPAAAAAVEMLVPRRDTKSWGGSSQAQQQSGETLCLVQVMGSSTKGAVVVGKGGASGSVGAVASTSASPVSPLPSSMQQKAGWRSSMSMRACSWSAMGWVGVGVVAAASVAAAAAYWM